MSETRALTEAQRRALEIVRDNPDCTAKDFAVLMWPDSPGWNRPAKCGPHGAHRGGGMYTSAGAFLAKLRKAGLVYRISGPPGRSSITPAGRLALKEHPTHD